MFKYDPVFCSADFRSVYGTVLDKWLKAPSQIVLGRKFAALGIV